MGGFALRLVGLFLFAFSCATGGTVEDIKSWLPFYGSWKGMTAQQKTDFIAEARQFDLVVLHPEYGPDDYLEAKDIVSAIQEGDDPADPADDVAVIGYISIGEDTRDPVEGDGRGPAFYDEASGQIVYQELGVAGYYLDIYPFDGVLEAHTTWKGAYVNAGHPDWIEFIVGANQPLSDGFPEFRSTRMLADVGFDGLFLDTPETPHPWGGMGWTSEGMFDMIKTLDETFPDKLMLLNRGLFFFSPVFPEQFKWNPAKHIDIALFESYTTDSDYGSNDYNISPFLPQNEHVMQVHVDIEVSRPGQTSAFVNIDYVKTPATIWDDHPDLAMWCWRRSTELFGKAQMLTDRSLVHNTNEMPGNLPTDTSPPKWTSSARGLSYKVAAGSTPLYASQGSLDQTVDYPKPRVGIQKAIPVADGITVRWDTAIDQTRPVRYNIIYDTQPLQLGGGGFSGTKLENVYSTMPAEYGDFENRDHTEADDACPFEFTVTGLTPNQVYYFAVRAFDGNLFEEDNQVQLATVYKPSTDTPSSVDGDTADFPTRFVVDGGNSFAVADDLNNLYVALNADADFANVAAGDAFTIYLNTDLRSFTGSSGSDGSSDYSMGADLRVKSDGTIESNDGSGWVGTASSATVMVVGSVAELAIPRSVSEDLNSVDGHVSLAVVFGGGARVPSTLSFSVTNIALSPGLPDETVAWEQRLWATYGFSTYPVDVSAPTFSDSTVTAVDASTSGQVDVSWAAASDPNGPITYRIYANLAGATPELKFTTTSTFGRISDLTNDETYTLTVTAEDRLGNVGNYASTSAVPTRDTVPPTWLWHTGIYKVEAGATDDAVRVIWQAAIDNTPPPTYFLFWSDQPFAGADDIDISAVLSEDNEAAVKVTQQPYDGELAYMFYYDFNLPEGVDRSEVAFLLRARDRFGNEDLNTVVKRLDCVLPCGDNSLGCDADAGACTCKDGYLGDYCNFVYEQDIAAITDANFESGALSQWGLLSDGSWGWTEGWLAPDWLNINPVVTFTSSDFFDGATSIRIDCTDGSGGGVLQHIVYADGEEPTNLRITGKSKLSAGHVGVSDPGYSLYADVTYANGDVVWGLTAAFPVTEGVWNEAVLDISGTASNPIKSFYFYVFLRSVAWTPHTGVALFDDINIYNFPVEAVNSLTDGVTYAASSLEEDISFQFDVSQVAADDQILVDVLTASGGADIYYRWNSKPDVDAALYDHHYTSTDTSVGASFAAQIGTLYIFVAKGSQQSLSVAVTCTQQSPTALSTSDATRLQLSQSAGTARVYSFDVTSPGQQLDISGDIPTVYIASSSPYACLVGQSCTSTQVLRATRSVSVSDTSVRRLSQGHVSYLRVTFGQTGTHYLTLVAEETSVDVDVVVRGKSDTLQSVTIDSREYATLDNADPHSTSTLCHSTSSNNQWIIADSNDSAALASAASFPWSTNCVVFSDGSAAATSGYSGSCASVAAPTLANGVDCTDGELRKVLVYRDVAAGAPDFTSTSVISSVLHFGSSAFAALDGVSPGESHSCQHHAKAIPAGWSVASPTGELSSLLLGTGLAFGADCIVLADGNSYSSIDPNTACDSSGQNLVQLGSFYKPSDCDAGSTRILITRASTGEETATARDTVAAVNPSNLLVHQGKQYATLDDAALSSSGCQQLSYALPTGWALASTQDWADGSTPNLPWTGCLLLDGGVTFDASACGSPLPTLLSATDGDGEVLYAPSACNARILIVADEGYVSPEAECFDAPAGAFVTVEPISSERASLQQYEYGLLEVHPPSDSTHTCASYQVSVPATWEVAPDDESTRADLQCLDRVADCALLANGESASAAGGSCLANLDFGYASEIDATTGNQCLSVAHCPAKVLLRRAVGFPMPLLDPSMEDSASTWWVMRDTATTTVTSGGRTGNGITVAQTDTSAEGGACQTVWSSGSNVGESGFQVSAWSKADNVGGSSDSNYAVYMDMGHPDGTYTWGIHSTFQVGTHDWEQATAQVTLGKDISFVTVCLLFRFHTGTVWFDDVEIDFAPRGLPVGVINNPSVFDAGYWYTLTGHTLVTVDDNASEAGGGNAVQLSNPGSDGSYAKGVGQWITSGFKVGEALICRASSKRDGDVTAQALSVASDYSLYVDYALNTNPVTYVWAMNAPFALTDTAGEWETVSLTIPTGQEVLWFQPWVLFRNHEGTVYFDDVTCYYDEVCPVTPVVSASLFGFGHLYTFDQFAYDLDRTGTFWVLNSAELSVQVFVEDVGGGVLAATTVLVQHHTHDHVLRIDRGQAINQEPVMLLDGSAFGGGVFSDGRATVSGFMANTQFVNVEVEWEQSEYRVEVKARYTEGVEGSNGAFQFLQVVVFAPQPDTTTGLLGDSDGDSTNDLGGLSMSDFVTSQLVAVGEVIGDSSDPPPSSLVSYEETSDVPSAVVAKCSDVDPNLYNACVRDSMVSVEDDVTSLYAISVTSTTPTREGGVLPDVGGGDNDSTLVIACIGGGAAALLIVAAAYTNHRRGGGRRSHIPFQSPPAGVRVDQVGGLTPSAWANVGGAATPSPLVHNGMNPPSPMMGGSLPPLVLGHSASGSQVATANSNDVEQSAQTGRTRYAS